MELDLWHVIVLIGLLSFIFSDDDVDKMKDVVSSTVDTVLEPVDAESYVIPTPTEIVEVVEEPETVEVIEVIEEPEIVEVVEVEPTIEEQIHQSMGYGILPEYCEKYGKFMECEKTINGERVKVECEQNGKELTCERL